MAKHINRWRASLVVYFFNLCFFISSLEDTITPNQSIRDGQTIVSRGGMFEIGFFSPQGSNNRYVGIWYLDIQPQTVVWVANREVPLTDIGGVLTLRNDGNLVIFNGSRKAVWYTNTSFPTNSTATLEDSGNLILRGWTSNDQTILWQSFDHPTDTLLEDMRLGNTSALRSWNNFRDPSPGSYAFKIDISQPQLQILISSGSDIYWKDIWTGTMFEGIPQEIFLLSFKSTESGEFTYSSMYRRTRLVMDMNGQLKLFIFYDTATQWTLVWSIPKEECNIYAFCGKNSICTDMGYSSSCSCLPGFEPALPNDWKAGKRSGGCTRKTSLCGKEEKEGFLYLKVKTRQKSFETRSTGDCGMLCLSDCGCTAYAYDNETRCQISQSDLVDLRGSTVEDANVEETGDLFIRLPASEIPSTRRSCEKCGNMTIPYPLSTGPNCGDPSYRSFTCDNFTGQLSFNAFDRSYQVINISPETRTFVIIPMASNYNDNPECNYLPSVKHEMQLDPSLPFNLTTNNIILMLNCSIPQTSSAAALNCNRSSTCAKYMQYVNQLEVKQQEEKKKDGRQSNGQQQCSLMDTSCCSYVAGELSSTSHLISLSSTGCTMYKSILNKSLGLPAVSWMDKVELEWELPSEPFCDLSKNCEGWPNSTCNPDKTAIGRKRCFCNAGFHWDNQAGYCFQDIINHSKHSKKLLTIIVPVSTIIGILSLGTFIFLGRRMYNQKDFQIVEGILKGDNFRENEENDLDVPFFDFQSIAVATNNFSDSNMLGRGGFGHVYKGALPGGQEMAVKRLSRSSEQGLEEFKNEVLLIAKLQHRNLVRLIGYCIQGDEKMLLYEYMPNKSLDYFLFDQNRRSFLDWEKRYNIILGIGRGLLYLHQDSRLRIIHRDLKASNVLLDEEMNPKISDFGLARMFGGNQTQGNTNRVVGTYGYMAPEYALDGHFSVKSDVFSFGVLLLEIISGKKNTGFYHSEHSLCLLEFAWRHWREEKGLELMDPLLKEGINVQDVLKCIHVGLLCVQEDATDRPTMATVVAMLVCETIASLPTPKQPAFYIRRNLFNVESSSSGPEIYSNNELTTTNLEGR